MDDSRLRGKAGLPSSALLGLLGLLGLRLGLSRINGYYPSSSFSSSLLSLMHASRKGGWIIGLVWTVAIFQR